MGQYSNQPSHTSQSELDGLKGSLQEHCDPRHSFHVNHVLVIHISSSICKCGGSFVLYNMLPENAICLLTEDFSPGTFKVGCSTECLESCNSLIGELNLDIMAGECPPKS